MSKYVHTSALALAEIRAIRILDTFTDRYNNSVFLCKASLDVLDEFFGVKCTFAQVDQLWTASAILSGKSCCCCQPAGISAHDFDDGNCRNVVYLAVADDFGEGRCDIFCSRAKSWTVIGLWQVVVDGLWCAHNIQVADIMLFDVSRQLVHCVHRVVSADVNKVSDLTLDQRIDDFFQLRFIRVVELETAGAQCCRRCVAEQIQLFRRCQNIGQIDIMSADDALDSVDRSIDAVYLAAGHAAFHNTRYGRVDRCRRSTRLCNQHVFHVVIPHFLFIFDCFFPKSVGSQLEQFFYIFQNLLICHINHQPPSHFHRS